MAHIVAEILSLIQHIKTFNDKPETYRPKRCLCCGRSVLQRHGWYPRKADRSIKSGQSLNPVLIQRFYCPGCRRTCSALPECIPPRRWYLWEIQQIALSLFLTGNSLRAIAQQLMSSRHTIDRWVKRFKEQLLSHKDTLCNHFIDLGRTTDFTDFWQACLGRFSLAKAMRLCYAAEIPVP